LDNAALAERFEQLANLAEIAGENAFKVRAYRAGAQKLRDLVESAVTIAREGGETALKKLPGIGGGIAKKIVQLDATGDMDALARLRERVPPTLLEVLALDGVGPKKVKLFYEALGLATVDQVEAAAKAGRLRSLSGMGKKSEEKILAAVERWRSHQGRFLRPRAEEDMARLLEVVRSVPGVERAEAAGSLRRLRETVGDLDIVCACADPNAVMDAFVARGAEVIGRGDTKCSIRLPSGPACDLRVVPAESWGAALHYFTGSKAHNVAVRGLARTQGLTVNEYGVFRLRDDGAPGERVAGSEEPEVFGCLGLDWIPPELREDRGEVEAAAAGALPELLEVGDMQGDVHMHSTWSDGRASILEMARAAMERGRRYVAITDHSAALAMTGGLDAARVRAQREEIREAQAAVGDGIRILCGIEVDILEDGSLDLPADVLADLDVVIASVHSHFEQDRDTMTARLLRAIGSRRVDAIGHPTGRLLLRRDAYDFDHARVFRAAAELGVALELSASPLRLDLNDVLARAAREAGCKLIISTDAHHPRQLDLMRHGVGTARRAWCARAHILNTEPDARRFLERLHEGHR
jgi:DNA polymerase (family 10)